MMVRKTFLKAFMAVSLLAFLLCVSASHAALLGIKDLLGYPDISFDIAGVLDYQVQAGGPSPQGTLTITGYDWLLTMTGSGPKYTLTDTNPQPPLQPFATSFNLQITVDLQGNLISGRMWEKVEEGEVTIGSKTYVAGTTLLQGDVYAFGFLAGTQGAENQFDFLVKNLSGALVNDGIWPTNVPTGIYAHAEGSWDGTFNNKFTLYSVSGDKAPVPIPATLMLLGSGLSALGVIRFRKNKRG